MCLFFFSNAILSIIKISNFRLFYGSLRFPGPYNYQKICIKTNALEQRGAFGVLRQECSMVKITECNCGGLEWHEPSHRGDASDDLGGGDSQQHDEVRQNSAHLSLT